YPTGPSCPCFPPRLKVPAGTCAPPRCLFSYPARNSLSDGNSLRWFLLATPPIQRMRPTGQRHRDMGSLIEMSEQSCRVVDSHVRRVVFRIWRRKRCRREDGLRSTGRTLLKPNPLVDRIRGPAPRVIPVPP